MGHQGVVIDAEETGIFTDTIHRFFLILQIEELHRGWAINYQLGCNIMIFVALNPLDPTFSWHRFAACHRFFDIDGVLLAHLCGFARHALREHFHLGDHLRGLLLAFSLAAAHYLTAVLPAGDRSCLETVDVGTRVERCFCILRSDRAECCLVSPTI